MVVSGENRTIGFFKYVSLVVYSAHFIYVESRYIEETKHGWATLLTLLGKLTFDLFSRSSSKACLVFQMAIDSLGERTETHSSYPRQ